MGSKSDTMKILMCTADFLPDVGGVAAVVAGLACGLESLGHRITVLHCRSSAAGIAETRLGKNIRVLSHTLKPNPYPWRKLTLANSIAQIIHKLDDAAGFDVIHWHTLYPDGLAATRYRGKARCVFTNHTSGFLEGARHPLRKIELAFLLKHFHHILAPSQELVQVSRSLGAPSVAYVPNGVDAQQFRPGVDSSQAARARLGFRSSDFVILAARRFEVKNGLRYFAEAFVRIHRQIPNAVAVFCGPDYDGIELPAVRAALGALAESDRVRFVGLVANRNMPSYYAAADVSVLPSLIEATSITALESMASALPVIATSVGGLPELIRHGATGLLVKEADSVSLANALLEVNGNPALRLTLGQAARELVLRQFCWQQIARLTEGQYAQRLSAGAVG